MGEARAAETSSAVRPLGWYRAMGLRTRAHVAMRWATSPIGPLAAMLPTQGRVLDWGCGHGVLALWLASRAPDIEVLGCDIDERKLPLAEAAASSAGLEGRVAFELVEAGDGPVGRWDAIVVNDVLYLLEPAAQEALVRAGCRALEQGGSMICAEMGDRPRWKARLAALQEQVAVRVVHLTASETGAATYPDPAVVASWMADEGLETETVDLSRGYHVPHVAVRGRRTATESRVVMRG